MSLQPNAQPYINNVSEPRAARSSIPLFISLDQKVFLVWHQYGEEIALYLCTEFQDEDDAVWARVKVDFLASVHRTCTSLYHGTVEVTHSDDINPEGEERAVTFSRKSEARPGSPFC